MHNKNKAGKGFLSTAQAFIFGRTKLPPTVRKILKSHGSQQISYIQIARNPLSAATRAAMNAVSLGDFDKKVKKLPYDSLYHLYMIIALKNNKQVLLEKNETIKMRLGKGARQDAEVKLVNVNKKISVIDSVMFE